jgi:hypothetical protein
MMSQNAIEFSTSLQGLSPTIRLDPAFTSIPEGEEEDDEGPVELVLEGTLTLTSAGNYHYTPVSSSASGSLDSTHPPPAPPDLTPGFNDSYTVAKAQLGRHVTNFGQGTTGSVPQQLHYSSATAPGSVSHRECPRHHAAGQTAGPHNLGEYHLGCGCCAHTCHICLADPPTTSTPTEEPETVATAAPAGELSPAGANVEDPIQASQASVSPNSLECELTSLDECFGYGPRESSRQSALMQTGTTTSATGPFSGQNAHSAFDWDELDAVEAAGVEPNAPPPEEERVIPEPPPGGPPIGPWTGAWVNAVPPVQIGTLVEQGDDDSDDSDTALTPTL